MCSSDAIAFDLDAGIYAVPGVCGHTVALQEMFLNLLGWCFGKLINDSDVARQHEVRHAWFKELAVLCCRYDPVDGRDDDHHVIFAELAWHRYCCSLSDVGVGQLVLDLNDEMFSPRRRMASLSGRRRRSCVLVVASAVTVWNQPLRPLAAGSGFL